MQNNNYNTNKNNTQPKEKGLGVGSVFRVWDMKSGTKADGGLWGMLNYTEKDKNKNVLQKYTIWLSNDSNFIANFPIKQTVDLKITEITNVKPEIKSYIKNGQNITERVINLMVKVEIVNVLSNTNNINNNVNYNNYNNSSSNNDYFNNNSEDTSVLDDLDFLG